MDGTRYVVDPTDPRAPSRAVWESLSQAERRRVVAALPSELPLAGPPEGDFHRLPKEQAREALEEHFGRRGRSVYVGSELPVYYPSEPVIAPDLFVVFDVPPQPRDRWVVADEGKGLDFVLEVHLRGDRTKDYERNVELFARLGIREYFVFDAGRTRLSGFSLADETYRPIVPQSGRWRSDVLDLDLTFDGAGHFRFHFGEAWLPFGIEVRDRLRRDLGSAVRRAEEEARRAEEEARRAEEEARRAEEEARRAEAYATKLRDLGIDPDNL
ncbi:MAG: Uma2 family endonuclease [Myxococcota bacterium]